MYKYLYCQKECLTVHPSRIISHSVKSHQTLLSKNSRFINRLFPSSDAKFNALIRTLYFFPAKLLDYKYYKLDTR